MAELSTVARPYAQALFSVARNDPVDLQTWADLVAEMGQVADLPAVRQALSNPRLDDGERVRIFTSLFKTPLPQTAVNFIELLVQNRRLALLPVIAEQFMTLKNHYEGTAQAEIVSAFELSQTQVNELAAALEVKFGLKIKPRITVDKSLIGGVRVVIGDQVLDTSVRAQLASMRTTLAA
jgi:F-type H+-transporting ATPase subunit delta